MVCEVTPEVIAEGISNAVRIHDAYCDLFLIGPFSLLPESRLPAAKGEVKSAILAVALVR